MLVGIQIGEDKLGVESHTGNWTHVSLKWLRDHCQCSECYHSDTNQRLVDSSTFPEELVVAEGKLSDDGLKVTVTWKHPVHQSEYSAKLFETLRVDPENLDIKRKLWAARDMPKWPFYGIYDDFMKDDKALLEFLEQVEQQGFCFVEGVPATSEATKAVSERVSYIRETIFGGYYEMTANLEHKDTAYTPLAIGPHTDGTYSNDAPSYQVLHCLEERCEGGENVLVDGFKIADIMKRFYTDQYWALCSIQVPGQYIDTAKGIHLMARRPVFRLNDMDELVQVSYNNHDRAPFLLNDNTSHLFYRALNTFARLCAHSDFHYRRKLLPGSVLFFDNWRILHARDAYSGYRKLAGAYFNKEDVESRLRVLRKG